MIVTSTALSGVLVIEPATFSDARGQFTETFSAERYESAGVLGPFVQDNVSRSAHGVLRGLHFQHPRAQAKLVMVLDGEIFDVAVDVRPGSSTFGAWHGEHLSAVNRRQLYVPPGFAHGFLVVSDSALVSYKCTDYYRADCEHVLRWDDPSIGIAWPFAPRALSERDERGVALTDVWAAV